MVNGARASGEHVDPTLRLLRDLTSEGALVAALQATHDKFRTYHDECGSSRRRVRTNEVLRTSFRRLTRTRRSFTNITRPKTTICSQHYGVLSEFLDAIVEELANQHVQLAAELAVLLEYAGRISFLTATEARMAELLGHLRELHRLVEAHLLLEEDATVPIVGTWTSWPL